MASGQLGIKEMVQLMGNMKKDIDILKSKNEELIASKQEIEQQLASTDGDLLSLQVENKKLLTANAALVSKVQASDKQLVQTKEQYEAQAQRINELQLQVSASLQSIQARDDELAAQAALLDELQATKIISSDDDQEKKVEKLEATVASLEARVSEATNAEKVAMDELSRFRNEFHNLGDLRDSLLGKVASLEAELDAKSIALEAKSVQIEKLENEVLEAKQAALDVETGANEVLESESAEKAELSRRAEYLEEQLQDMENLRHTNAKLEFQLKELNSEPVETYEEDIQTLTDQLKEKEENLLILRKENAEVCARMKQVEDDHQALILSSKEQLQDLERNLEQRKAELAEKQGMVDSMRNANSTLVSRVEELKVTIENLTSQKDEGEILANKINELEAMVEEEKQNFHIAKTEKESLIIKVKELEAMVQNSKLSAEDQVLTLKDELSKTKLNLENQISTTASLQSTNSELDSKVTALESALSTSKSLDTEIQSLQSEKEELNLLVKDLESRTSTLEAENTTLDAKLKDAQEELEILNAKSAEELETLSTQVKSLESDLKGEQGTSQSRMDEIDSLNSKMQELQRELENKKRNTEHVEALTSELTQLKKELNESMSLASQTGQVIAREAESNIKSQEIQQALEEMQVENESLKAIVAEKEAATAKALHDVESHHNLKIQEKVTALEETERKLTEITLKLKDEREESRKRISQLNDDLAKAKEGFESSAAQVSVNHEKLLQLESQLVESQQEVEAQVSRISDLESSLRECEADLASHVSAEKDLKEQLEAARQQVNVTSAAHAERLTLEEEQKVALQQELDAIRVKLDETENQKSELRTMLQGPHNSESVEIAEAVKLKILECETLTKELETLSQTVSNLSEERNCAINDKDAIQKQLNSLEQEYLLLKEQQSDITSLNKEEGDAKVAKIEKRLQVETERRKACEEELAEEVNAKNVAIEEVDVVNGKLKEFRLKFNEVSAVANELETKVEEKSLEIERYRSNLESLQSIVIETQSQLDNFRQGIGSGWIEETLDHPAPPFGLDSTEVQYLFRSWREESKDTKVLTSWCKDVLNGKAASSDPSFRHGIELTQLQPHVCDGFIKLLVPLLRTAPDTRVTVHRQDNPKITCDLRLRVEPKSIGNGEVLI